MTLFDKARVAGTFLGFSEGGLEFHADLVLPYDSQFQSSPMHGQFVMVALEHDNEAILGRITTIEAQGRLVTPSGEDYAIRAVQEDRPIPDDLRTTYLKYRVDIRILGVLRAAGGDMPPLFVASHRRLPHVGAKVAFLSDDLLRQVAGATTDPTTTAELGFLAFGEFVFAGDDDRARSGSEEWLQVLHPDVIPRFDIRELVSRRSLVFARAGFGKSNLVKLLFSSLYGRQTAPTVVVGKDQNGTNRTVNVGTLIFDPDGEYYWPDNSGRPGLCDVPTLKDQIVIFTDKESPSDFYGSFVVGKVKLDIRELPPVKVISLVISSERQDQQNVVKLKQLRSDRWQTLVDAVWRDRNSTDLHVFYEALELRTDGSQDAEALAARSNMTRVVTALHDPSSQLLRALKHALSEGKLCVIDISQMRGAQGLALAGVILQHIFEHNQAEFTKKNSHAIPSIAVVEEAQSVLTKSSSTGDEPFIDWVKEGRKYNLGAVLITQQPGSIPPEILSQGDNWFVFHLLSAGDLRALKHANAHFSDDLLSSLLNEPIRGHGVFWSSSGGTPYPISIRALLFEAMYQPADPLHQRDAVDTYAYRLRKELAGALAQAVQEAGGKAVTVANTMDATETYKLAAINRLSQDHEFQTRVRSERGIPWGDVQRRLAEALPDAVGSDKRAWVTDQRLVVKALDEILGPQDSAWISDRRPKADDPSRRVVWVTATPQAKTATEEIPVPPDDWEPDEGESDGHDTLF